MGYQVIEKKRREDLDILKGIGILLMVYDHAINVCGGYDKMAFTHQYIQSFHMPLFFIVSGFLWKRRNNQEEIRRKTISLLVPYVLFAIVYLALISIKATVKMDLKPVLRFVAGMLIFPTNSGYTDFASPIWFLVAIFNVEVVYNFIRSRFKMGGGTALILILAVGGCIYSLNQNLPILPFAIEPTATGLLLFEIGNRMKGLQNSKYLNRPGYVIAVMLVIQILLLKLNGTIDMRSARYYNGFMFFISAIFGTVIYWNISNLLLRHGVKGIRALEFVSRYSLIYLGINFFTEMVIAKIMEIIIHGLMPRIIITFLIGMIVMTLLAKPLNIAITKVQERVSKRFEMI